MRVFTVYACAEYPSPLGLESRDEDLVIELLVAMKRIFLATET